MNFSNKQARHELIIKYGTKTLIVEAFSPQEYYVLEVIDEIGNSTTNIEKIHDDLCADIYYEVNDYFVSRDEHERESHE